MFVYMVSGWEEYEGQHVIGLYETLLSARQASVKYINETKGYATEMYLLDISTDGWSSYSDHWGVEITKTEVMK